MIEIIKHKTDIKFTSFFGITSVVSTLLVIGSLVALFTTMKYGVDFRGGAEIQVKFTEAVSVGDVRSALVGTAFRARRPLGAGESAAGIDRWRRHRRWDGRCSVRRISGGLHHVVWDRYAQRDSPGHALSPLAPQGGSIPAGGGAARQ